MNSIQISGRLVKEPELHPVKDAPAGKWVRFATASVAVDAGADKDGSRKAYFFDIAFRVYSERFVALLAKGANVIAVGSLSYRDWEKDGKKGRSYGINADRVEVILPPKPADEPDGIPADDLPF